MRLSARGDFPALIENLIATKKPVMLMALGNPYLLRSFPGVAAYLTTCSSVPVSEIAAVKALFGEIPIAGKLPVSIPGFAQYGDDASKCRPQNRCRTHFPAKFRAPNIMWSLHPGHAAIAAFSGGTEVWPLVAAPRCRLWGRMLACGRWPIGPGCIAAVSPLITDTGGSPNTGLTPGTCVPRRDSELLMSWKTA